MNKVNFNDLDKKVSTILQKHNIKESDLFTHESDLYVGFNSIKTYNLVYEELFNIGLRPQYFKPQDDSDMGKKFVIGMDIPFANMLAHFANRIKSKKL